MDPLEFAWPGAMEFGARNQASDMSHQVLFVGDDPVGSMALTFLKGRVLRDEDQPFLLAIGRQAALALRVVQLSDQARLASMAHEQEKAAERRSSELAKTNRALKQTLDIVAFEPDLEKVPGQVLAAISRQLESSSSALWLFDRENANFKVQTVYQEGQVLEFSNYGDGPLTAIWPSDRTLALKNHILERRSMVYHTDELQQINTDAYSFLSRLGITTTLGVPLVLGYEVVGSLTVRFSTRRVPSPEDLELTQAMAHQATMAIQLTHLAKLAGEAAVNQERAKLARDVHDTLAQGFTGILLQLGAASQVPGNQRSEIESNLRAINDLARSSLADARRSVRTLRVKPETECRLDHSLQQFVRSARLQTGAEIALKVNGVRRNFEPHVENELCRVVQEALNNAVKHASASKVTLSVDFQNDGAVRLSVKDDGVGFDLTQPRASDSFGLIGMQERADLVGASLTLVSEPGRGAEIIVQFGQAGKT
jgi:signal transduction histidine kinase